LKKSRRAVKTNRSKRESPIPVPETQSAFHRHARFCPGRYNIKLTAMTQQRPVETVEEFKLRIAAIIRAKPEQITAPRQRSRFHC
jgi:hypothetical protein